MSAAERIQIGGIVLAVLCAIAVAALWIVPYLVERIGAPRFAWESMLLEAAEDNRWAEYKRTGEWPAEPPPARRWRVGDLLARLRARNAAILAEREARRDHS